MNDKPPDDPRVNLLTLTPPPEQHFLLRLMPYPSTAASRFVELQSYVESMQQPLLVKAARVQAFMDTVKLLRARFGDLQTSSVRDLEGCLAHRLFNEVPSFVVLEHLAKLSVTNSDLELDDDADGGSGLPTLARLKDGKPVKTGPSEANVLWSTAESQVISLFSHELEELDDIERKSALRMLRLRALFGNMGPANEREKNRLAWFQSTGDALWRKLLPSGIAPEPSAVYGYEAREALLRRLEMSAELAQATLVIPTPDRTARSASSAEQGMHLVVRDRIPDGTGSDERALLKRFEILRRPMPLAVLPAEVEVEALQATLCEEFPWAFAAISSIFLELRARRRFGSTTVGFAPVLLVGPPGSGKSRLARRIGEVLDVGSVCLSVGGSSDSRTLLGTSRGWSSAQPSMLVSTYLHGCATTLVVLDEIDKPGESAHNASSMRSALLGLLEPTEARAWFDECLQVHCDLTSLLYIGTANDLTWIPSALLSRFRVMHIRRPTPAGLRAAIPTALRDVEQEWRLPEGTFRGLGIEDLVQGRLDSGRQLREAVRFAVARWMARSGPSNAH